MLLNTLDSVTYRNTILYKIKLKYKLDSHDFCTNYNILRSAEVFIYIFLSHQVYIAAYEF